MGWIRQRLLYWFDKTMARGTFALVGWLAAICVLTDIPISVLLVSTRKEHDATLRTHLIEIWKMIGSTFKVGGQVGPPIYVLGSIGSAVVALLFASTLVSLITAGVNKKIMDLRKGRSAVLESGHVVVVGWSAEVFFIAAELKAAGSRHGRTMLAVLADRDKAAMEDEIRVHVRDARVTCRSGNPVVPSDVNRISPQSARCVIVLAPPGPDADEQVIKTILAIRNLTSRPVVAAIADHDNLPAAIKAAGPNARFLDADDLASRWIAQAALQPGLAMVFSELLRFNGNELCVCPSSSSLAGQTFGEVLHAFAAASPVGLIRADGTLMLNPPSEQVVADEDLIVAISAQDVFAPAGVPQIDEDAIVTPRPRRRAPVRLLMLGWNRRSARIIRQLDAYVPAGSRIDILADHCSGQVRSLEKLRTDLNHAEISLRPGDPTDFDLLSSFDLASYQHIILLSTDTDADSHADFRSLVTLLHLRDLEARLGRPLGITGEIADEHTLALAPAPRGNAPTFSEQGIVSRTMVSHLMTQVATNPDIVPIFTDLFDPEGSEIFLRPVADYIHPGHPVTFSTVVESARRQAQVAIGYRLAAGRTIHLNPDRTQPLSFASADQVIVLSEP